MVSDICPHFCRLIGTSSGSLDDGEEEDEIILMEDLSKCNHLTKFVSKRSEDECVVYSAIKQVLMALEIAQRLTRFTHYDLHTHNILMKR